VNEEALAHWGAASKIKKIPMVILPLPTPMLLAKLRIFHQEPEGFIEFPVVFLE
jgi:hypothetical protein